MQFLWNRKLHFTIFSRFSFFFGHFKKTLSLQKGNDSRCGESNTDNMDQCATIRELSLAEREREGERESCT